MSLWLVDALFCQAPFPPAPLTGSPSALHETTSPLDFASLVVILVMPLAPLF